LTNESNACTTVQWTADDQIVFDAVDNNRPHIWIMNADGSNARRLTANDSFDYEPRVSPDGRFIVFTSRRTGETKVWRMNIDGSNPKILSPAAGAAYGPVVVPEQNFVLFHWVRESGKVWGRVPIAGGEATEYPLDSFSRLAVSPDGRQIAYIFYDETEKRSKVRVRPFETAEPSTVFNISPVNFLLWTNDGKSLLYRELESMRDASSILLQQSLAGGPPKPFLAIKSDGIFGAAQSKTDKKIALIRGTLLTDAVMLTQIRPK
jgi:TolB protein